MIVVNSIRLEFIGKRKDFGHVFVVLERNNREFIGPALESPTDICAGAQQNIGVLGYLHEICLTINLWNILFQAKVSAKNADIVLSSENESILTSEQSRVGCDSSTSVWCSRIPTKS